MTYAVPVVDPDDVRLDAAGRDGTPYVAELAENSAGR